MNLLEELWEHCRKSLLPGLAVLSPEEREKNLFMQGATAVYILLDTAHDKGKIAGFLTRVELVRAITEFERAEDAAGRNPEGPGEGTGS